MFLYNNYINSKKQVHIKENGSLELLVEMIDFIRTLDDDVLMDEIKQELDLWLRVGRVKYQMMALSIIDTLEWDAFKPTIEYMLRYFNDGDVSKKATEVCKKLNTLQGTYIRSTVRFLYNNFLHASKFNSLIYAYQLTPIIVKFIEELEDPPLLTRIQTEIELWLQIGDSNYCIEALTLVKQFKWLQFRPQIEKLKDEFERGHLPDMQPGFNSWVDRALEAIS